MNPDLDRLQPYPFERLSVLLRGITPPAGCAPVNLSIGEPKHPTPEWIPQTWLAHAAGLAQYPVTRGTNALREAIRAWLVQRFQLPAAALDSAQHILPTHGSRESLFAAAQALLDRTRPAGVAMPNPFYQIYEGAALLAGGTPYYLNTTAATHFLADFAAVPAQVWQDCQLLYLCSPGNPTGAVLSQAQLTELIALAQQHDFILLADECYSELYYPENSPPCGLLQAAWAAGYTDFARCLVFHSLSKRSNAPGLRSGFVAGDARLIAALHRYRTYHGCALPPPTQAASAAAWSDETHVQQNRALYQAKYATVCPLLGVPQPAGGFYLWLAVPGDDAAFARQLYAEHGVTVLPGSFLSRTAHGINPGAGYVRLALVAPLTDCISAAQRIRTLLHP